MKRGFRPLSGREIPEPGSRHVDCWISRKMLLSGDESLAGFLREVESFDRQLDRRRFLAGLLLLGLPSAATLRGADEKFLRGMAAAVLSWRSAGGVSSFRC